MGLPEKVGRKHRELYMKAFEVAQTHYLTGKLVDCRTDIELDLIDLTKFGPTIAVPISYDPLNFVVFFYGEPPDLTEFLDPTNNESLIGPVLSFRHKTPRYNDNGALLNGWDITRAFNTIQRAHPNGLNWGSVECSNFSYIEFQEK